MRDCVSAQILVNWLTKGQMNLHSTVFMQRFSTKIIFNFNAALQSDSRPPSQCLCSVCHKSLQYRVWSLLSRKELPQQQMLPIHRWKIGLWNLHRIWNLCLHHHQLAQNDSVQRGLHRSFLSDGTLRVQKRNHLCSGKHTRRRLWNCFHVTRWLLLHNLPQL